MIDRLTSKRAVLVLVNAAASIILVSGSREWVSGSTGDVVLGASALHGRGSDIAPGALATAVVGMTSGVVAATAGSVTRLAAAGSALLAAVLGVSVVISVLVDPDGALGKLAAAGTGRGGTFAVHGRVGAWVWAALAAMLVMGIGALGALVGRRHWHGFSSSVWLLRSPAGPWPSSASSWLSWAWLPARSGHGWSRSDQAGAVTHEH